jgi:RNA polymerase sigma factor (TIGR02999 family)
MAHGPPSPGEVTRLLNEAGGGGPSAAAELLPLVYQQLRVLARKRMSREPSDQTLQATALVHEAYLRLVDADALRRWDSRWHFFAAAAESMRRILVENARRRRRLKRGGGAGRVCLDDVTLAAGGPGEDVLALDEALTALTELQPDKAELVKLRYFAGLTLEEAAEALGISRSTADRHWAYARAWLFRQMNGDACVTEDTERNTERDTQQDTDRPAAGACAVPSGKDSEESVG